jgi:hypothetical protein
VLHLCFSPPPFFSVCTKRVNLKPINWLYGPLLGPGRFFFSFLILIIVDRTPWTGDQPVARPLPCTQNNTNTE